MSAPNFITIDQVMTVQPITIDRQADLHSARTLLSEHDIHHLVVLENDNPEFIVTRADIDRLLTLTKDNDLTLGDAQAGAYLAEARDPLSAVLTTMAAHHGAPVIILKEGELVGIFTSADACRLLADSVSSNTAQ